MDNDFIKYTGGFTHGKTYILTAGGRVAELGRPQEIKFEHGDFGTGNDVYIKASWIEPLVPDSITNELAGTMSNYFEDRLVQSSYRLPKQYIINDGATILFWADGTKTIVKRSKDEKFDKRLGFLTAYFQKHCGMSKTKANKFLDNLEVEE